MTKTMLPINIIILSLKYPLTRDDFQHLNKKCDSLNIFSAHEGM